MRSVRLTTVLLVLAVAGLVAALVVGAQASREKSTKDSRAKDARTLAITTWPKAFVRVPNASIDCRVATPSICLSSPDDTTRTTARMAIALGSSSAEKAPAIPGAPQSYVVRGTIGNDRTAVVASVFPHMDLAASKAKNTKVFKGSDVTVELAAAD